MSERGIGTRAVHGRRSRRTGALTVPIEQSSTFVFESSAEMRRYLGGDPSLYLYTRYANPTLDALESAIAELEGAEAGLVFASGMAAMTTALVSLVSAGDEIVASSSLYGGTTKLVRDVLGRFGVASRIVAPAELEELEKIAGAKTRVVVFESPTNPSVDVLDVAKITAAARARGIVTVMDNTFATPVLQRPIGLGVDIVMHSLTKSLSGHSDIIGGALLGSRERIGRARDVLKVLGGCLDPHAAFLALRGLKTVHLRVERQCASALALARHFEGHAKLVRVLYPGLASHPGHAIAKRQMSAFGGVVTLVLKGGLAAAERFYDGLELVSRAASLGGTETLISLPVHTSHHGYTPEQLKAAGVDPGSARIALGVEDVADLIDDVARALERA